MTPQRKRSRKRFAAKSIAEKRLEQAVFYLDESIYSLVLVESMHGAGANIEHAGGVIPRGATDDVWLGECGKRGWIVLTRDKHIRHRRLERDALKASGVPAFALTAGAATAKEVADTIVPLIQKFVNMSVSEPRPFLYTFGLKGWLTKVKLHH